ncbi:hypothetical protein GGR54DRAFT_638439 [Hypoxylon sp. NC1633]|nr:hypothetical protein GGR54DRAFT_638439 [Hypoxylon sp. NC1633]
MATPGQLEEGHEMNSIHHQTRKRQHPPRIPVQSGSNPRTSDAHASPISPSRTPREEIHQNFRSNSHILRTAPKGWPSIAAFQMYYENFSIHRRFSNLMQRVLMDQETKLAYLENKLEELDQEDDRINKSRIKKLPFDPDSLLATYTRAQAQARSTAFTEPPLASSRGGQQQEERAEEYAPWKDKDLLLETIVPRLKSYIELLQLDKEMHKLHPVSRLEHVVFFDEIHNHHRLDESAYQSLYLKDDFVTTVTDRWHQYFETPFYAVSPIIIRLKQLFGQKSNNNDGDQAQVIEIEKRSVKIFFKILVASFSGALLLSPVAILFLVELSRGLSFVVVVAFLLLFVIALSTTASWETLLFGLSAYMAVLVTFLANIG